MNEKEIIKKHYQAIGRKGGKSIKERFGSSHFSGMGRKSARVRRENKKSV